jgi:cytochrome c-type biogenesis protein
MEGDMASDSEGKLTPSAGRRWALRLLSFGLPMLTVAAMLALLIRFRGEIETGVANFSLWLPLGYAFAAGMVASVNPCGVLMLPAYISYHVTTEEAGHAGRSAARKAGRAILLSVAITLAFVMIFGLSGAIISAGGRWLVDVFPYAGALIGAAMMGLGAWLLITNRHLGIEAAARVTVSPRRSLWNAFVFGLVYAIASLSCTLPIFLVLIGGTLATSDWGQSLRQFVGYALGMGSVVAVVMVAASLFEELVTRLLLRVLPYVERVGALFLLGAGLYLVYYWIVLAGFSR